ncbi:MAG: hypothetical protein BGO96_04685 [Micrococcales bacterium 73-15]|uniref:hypothetical protein n=1 Tax=Salana multivorans TaxID=120377 RepID=UPI00096306C3|nr:hypothetical protein [Salana multivorans]OJX98677.1 MAG: hypothetical protein BGO96_04685 [Micrococcales bacterium 73-15]
MVMVLVAEALAGPPPMVGLTVSGAGSGPAVFEVSWDGGGSWRRVRSRAGSIVGSTYVRDHVCPLNVPSIYRVTVAGETAVSAPVTVVSDVAWIQDPLSPRGAVPVQCVRGEAGLSLLSPSLGEQSRRQVVDMVTTDGSAYPAAAVGPRMAPVGMGLHLRAAAAAQGALVTAMRALIASGSQIVLRGLPPDLGLDAVAHVVAPDVTDAPIVGGVLGLLHDWQLTIHQVRPVSTRISVPFWTYAQVRAMWPASTYAQTRAARPGDTYIDWLKSPEP